MLTQRNFPQLVQVFEEAVRDTADEDRDGPTQAEQRLYGLAREALVAHVEELEASLAKMVEYRDNTVASISVAMSQAGYFKGLCMAQGIAYEDNPEFLGDMVNGIPGHFGKDLE